jgi:hypothetical protein
VRLAAPRWLVEAAGGLPSQPSEVAELRRSLQRAELLVCGLVDELQAHAEVPLVPTSRAGASTESPSAFRAAE